MVIEMRQEVDDVIAKKPLMSSALKLMSDLARSGGFTRTSLRSPREQVAALDCSAPATTVKKPTA
jgi:hypothetical protein